MPRQTADCQPRRDCRPYPSRRRGTRLAHGWAVFFAGPTPNRCTGAWRTSRTPSPRPEPPPIWDIDGILQAAKNTGCDAIHPGYGFLSENAEFARRCADANLTFVGAAPRVAGTVRRQGPKPRALAERLGVPILSGTSGPTSLSRGRPISSTPCPPAGAMLVKAIGGGGWVAAMRVVRRREELEDAYARCQSEGAGGVRQRRRVRGTTPCRAPGTSRCRSSATASGAVSHLGERDCSIQRRPSENSIEIAPAPGPCRTSLRQRTCMTAGA